MKKPLHWVLLVSLVVNLFLVGVVAAYHTSGGMAGPAMGSQLRIERIAETLPKADAERLDVLFRARAAELGEFTAAIRQSQVRQRDAFRATPFDPKPAAAAMEATRYNHDAAKRVIHEVILRAAEQMSPEGRAKLAEWAAPPPVNAP
ncbi:MAG: periplasmic heavy metal sensor [Alphaproteobacteria bacterium]|nr:periplasmic heavy metal sensor [Alphaproteobacteria bacterium]